MQKNRPWTIGVFVALLCVAAGVTYGFSGPDALKFPIDPFLQDPLVQALLGAFACMFGFGILYARLFAKKVQGIKWVLWGLGAIVVAICLMTFAMKSVVNSILDDPGYHGSEF